MARPISKNEPTMSFSGCGFLGVYHIGVCSCLRQYAPQLYADRVIGASAGALAAACLLTDCCLGDGTSATLNIVSKIRAKALGPFSPSIDIVKFVRDGFSSILPDNAHEICSGRLYISMTRLSDRKNVLISQFETREELLDALVCTSFIPLWSGIFPPSFRGETYIDGAFSDNLATFDSGTITVSPFAGEADICPTDYIEGSFEMNFANTSLQFSHINLYRLSRVILPPSPETLAGICAQGFDDALKYLHRNALINCTRCVNVQSSLDPVYLSTLTDEAGDQTVPQDNLRTNEDINAFYSSYHSDTENDFFDEDDIDQPHLDVKMIKRRQRQRRFTEDNILIPPTFPTPHPEDNLVIPKPLLPPLKPQQEESSQPPPLSDITMAMAGNIDDDDNYYIDDEPIDHAMTTINYDDDSITPDALERRARFDLDQTQRYSDNESEPETTTTFYIPQTRQKELETDSYHHEQQGNPDVVQTSSDEHHRYHHHHHHGHHRHGHRHRHHQLSSGYGSEHRSIYRPHDANHQSLGSDAVNAACDRYWQELQDGCAKDDVSDDELIAQRWYEEDPSHEYYDDAEYDDESEDEDYESDDSALESDISDCQDCRHHVQKAMADKLPPIVTGVFDTTIAEENKTWISRLYNTRTYRTLVIAATPVIFPFELSIMLYKKFFNWLPNLPSDIKWIINHSREIVHDVVRLLSERHEVPKKFQCDLAITDLTADMEKSYHAPMRRVPHEHTETVSFVCTSEYDESSSSSHKKHLTSNTIDVSPVETIDSSMPRRPLSPYPDGHLDHTRGESHRRPSKSSSITTVRQDHHHHHTYDPTHDPPLNTSKVVHYLDELRHHISVVNEAPNSIHHHHDVTLNDTSGGTSNLLAAEPFAPEATGHKLKRSVSMESLTLDGETLPLLAASHHPIHPGDQQPRDRRPASPLVSTGVPSSVGTPTRHVGSECGDDGGGVSGSIISLATSEYETDSFEAALHHTDQMDRILAFYYMDENHHMKVMEIFKTDVETTSPHHHGGSHHHHRHGIRHHSSSHHSKNHHRHHQLSPSGNTPPLFRSRHNSNASSTVQARTPPPPQPPPQKQFSVHHLEEKEDHEDGKQESFSSPPHQLLASPSWDSGKSQQREQEKKNILEDSGKFSPPSDDDETDEKQLFHTMIADTLNNIPTTTSEFTTPRSWSLGAKRMSKIKRPQILTDDNITCRQAKNDDFTKTAVEEQSRAISSSSSAKDRSILKKSTTTSSSRRILHPSRSTGDFFTSPSRNNYQADYQTFKSSREFRILAAENRLKNREREKRLGEGGVNTDSIAKDDVITNTTTEEGNTMKVDDSGVILLEDNSAEILDAKEINDVDDDGEKDETENVEKTTDGATTFFVGDSSCSSES